MSDRPAFTLDIQPPFDPAATKISGDFIAVRIAGDEHTGAEVFITTQAEAQAFIDVFTEARDMLAGDGPPEYDPEDAEAQRIAEGADARAELDRGPR